jgi:hypothetical protein
MVFMELTAPQLMDRLGTQLVLDMKIMTPTKKLTIKQRLR